MFLSSGSFLNCYDFANMLQMNLYGNCYFAWDIKDLVEGLNAKAYYNLFTNIKRKDQMNSLKEPVEIDIDAIRWIVEYGVRQTQGMVEAGFLKRHSFVQKNVPEWVLNIHSYYTDAIIRAYHLVPLKHPDETSKVLGPKKPQEQFNEDAQYRKTVLLYMMTSLCKYGIEFGKITSVNGNVETVNYNFLLH